MSVHSFHITNEEYLFDFENPETNQVDIIANHYIDPSEPDVMIYTLIDVDSGKKLVQHMNRLCTVFKLTKSGFDYVCAQNSK